jgi:hypothetical protein
MEISRRSFFKAASLTALSAGLFFRFKNFAWAQNGLGKGYFPVPIESQGDPLSQLNRSSFEPCLKSYFYFQSSEGEAVYLQFIKMNDTMHLSRSA